MSTSSFDKEFIITSKKECDSFIKIVNTPIHKEHKRVNKGLITPERQKSAEESVRRMLNRG